MRRAEPAPPAWRILLAAPLVPLPLRPLLALRGTLDRTALAAAHPAVADLLDRLLLPATTETGRPFDLVVTTTTGALSYHTATPGLLVCGSGARPVLSRIALARSGGAPPDPDWLFGPAFGDLLHELGHLVLRRLYGYLPRTLNLLAQLRHAPETPSNGTLALVEGFAHHFERAGGADFMDWHEFTVKRGDLLISEYACARLLDETVAAGLVYPELYRILAVARPWTVRGLIDALRRESTAGAERVNAALETVAAELPLN